MSSVALTDPELLTDNTANTSDEAINGAELHKKQFYFLSY